MPCTVPFFVGLMDGDEKLIARIGALTVVVRCELDFQDEPEERADFMTITVTSSVDGWFVTEPGGSGSRELSAGDEAGLASNVLPLIGQQKYLSPSFSRPSAAAPDGSFVTLAADHVGLGTNIFGFDCIATGVLFRYKVSL